MYCVEDSAGWQGPGLLVPGGGIIFFVYNYITESVNDPLRTFTVPGEGPFKGKGLLLVASAFTINNLLKHRDKWGNRDTSASIQLGAFSRHCEIS